MKKLLIIIFLVSNLYQIRIEAQVSHPNITEVDDFVNAVVDEVGFPGVGMAIIKNGKVIHRKNYGFANLEHEVATTDRTTYQLYSLTKPVIAVSIFQFVEKKKLSLEDRITDHINEVPKEWKEVKIKHLLTHCSGLPDMFGSNPFQYRELNEEESKERIFKMPLRFEAGEKYEYNQSNYWALKEIIERLSGKTLENHIRITQFPDSDESTMYFLSDAREIVKHRATSYFPWVKGHLTIDLPYVNGDYFLACNGLHVTVEEMIKWNRRLTNNELITPASKKIMWAPFTYKSDDTIFANGWNIHNKVDGDGYGFTGSSVTMYRIIPEKGLSVIFLANGFSQYYSQHALMDEIVRLVENR